jgi:host factor-I protein
MPFQKPDRVSAHKGRTPPPAETSQEAAYLRMLVEKQKPVSIKLVDGEVVQGWIEYYDKDMLRLTRDSQPNLFIYKHEIAYLREDDRKARTS